MTKNQQSDTPTQFTRPTPAHARAHKGPRMGKVLALTLVSLLGLGASMAYGVSSRINSTVNKIDTKSLVSEPELPKDPRAGQSLNILVMGTDSREGDNGSFSKDKLTSQRSDTTMIVHISSDRKRVEVVSMPRDAMVQIPECKATNGQVIPATGAFTEFNEAFSRGWTAGKDYASAAACTQETIQSITGLHIDHSVIVDFQGFVGMVDALGGITIDVPEDVYSPKADNLRLEKGKQKLKGKKALKLVRARTGTGWGLEIGSDLKRIERQQAVLQATIQTALSKNMLTDVGSLTSFVTASLASLTVDSDLDANKIIGLAFSLKDLNLDDVQFYSTPVVDSARKRYKVDITAEAETYWQKLRIDEPITEPEPDCSDTDQTDAIATTSPDGPDASKSPECEPSSSTSETTD